MGVRWAADCGMQWFIILGSLDYNITLLTSLSVKLTNLWEEILSITLVWHAKWWNVIKNTSVYFLQVCANRYEHFIFFRYNKHVLASAL